jgi:hypothetical protein
MTTIADCLSEWQVRSEGYYAAFGLDFDEEFLLPPEILEPERSKIRLDFDPILITGLTTKNLPEGLAFSGVRRLATGIFIEFWFPAKPTQAQLKKLKKLTIELLQQGWNDLVHELLYVCWECRQETYDGHDRLIPVHGCCPNCAKERG